MTAPDTAAIRAQMEALKSSGWPSYHAAAPDMYATILALCDALDAGAARDDELRAEIERLREALIGMDLEPQRGIVSDMIKPTLVHLVMKMSDGPRAALAQGDR